MKKSFKHFYKKATDTPVLAVNGVGVCEPMHPGIIDRPNGTGDCLLMFFYEDQQVNVEFGKVFIPANSMIYWENCGHYYGRTDISWNHSWIHFEGKESLKIIRKAGLKPYQVISPDAELLENLLIGIDDEMCRPEPDTIIVRNKFEILVREIVRSSGCETKQIPKKLLDIKRYIEDNYYKQLSLDLLSRNFGMSRPHFSSEFKRWFGSAPVEYQIECRLREAELLLLDRNLQVADVAEKVGWDDVCHFSKIFKKHRAFSPSKLRR